MRERHQYPDDRARVQAVVDEALKTGEPFVVEQRFVAADGIVRHVETRGQASRRADGKLDVGSFNRGDLTLGRAEYVATDVNNDGKTDVMITTVWGSYLYLGRSDGFSQDHLIYEGLELGRVSFFPSDFNGDNYGDLMISTASGSFLYTGKRDGTFKPDVYIRPGLKLFGVSFY